MDFDAQGMTPANVFAADAQLHVQFYRGAVFNEAKTEANGGVPVFEDKPFIRIYVPHDQTLCIDGPAWIDSRLRNAHNHRFPKQWAAFQAGDKEQQAGIPLSEFPALVESQRKTLAYLQVHTVEMLAAASDDALKGLLGGQELRAKARVFLKAREDAAHTLKQDKELHETRSRLAELEAALSDLKKQGAKPDVKAK